MIRLAGLSGWRGAVALIWGQRHGEETRLHPFEFPENPRLCTETFSLRREPVYGRAVCPCGSSSLLHPRAGTVRLRGNLCRSIEDSLWFKRAAEEPVRNQRGIDREGNNADAAHGKH